MEESIVEKRYLAAPIRWSANANQHKQRRRYNCNSNILKPAKTHFHDSIGARAARTEANHIEQDQIVIDRTEKEDSQHLHDFSYCSRLVQESSNRSLLETNLEEHNTVRVREDILETTNENPSRPASTNEHLYHATHDRRHPMDPMRQSRDNYSCSQRDHHQVRSQPNLSCNLTSAEMRQVITSKKSRTYNLASDMSQGILLLFFMNFILNHLSNNLSHLPTTNDKQQYRAQVMRIFPTIIGALATTTAEINTECRRDSDCDDMRCYQGKCICPKERPIEDRGICLPLAILGEVCTVSEQCLGNSGCLDGYCSCPTNTVSVWNPSSRLSYCHPKRRLREECSNEAQCPTNSFCSLNKCLCVNGYGPVTVKGNDDVETSECLPKSCSSSKDCESEYHICEDNRCICLADNFDPHTAECYKFGSTGGKLSGNQTTDDNATSSTKDNARDNKRGIVSILKDLMKNSDKLWYVIVILAVLTIILLALIVMSLRKYFLGYCWTAHKKEYEPNNESAPKSGYFNKDSINNKSFRQKNGEVDDDGDDIDDTAADRSNLVTTVNKGRGALLNKGDQRLINNNQELADTENRYVKVDMRAASAIDEDQQQSYEQANSTNTNYQPYHQQLLSRPLSTSNSTAV